MLDPGRISKPQLFVVRKIIGDRNKLAKWQKIVCFNNRHFYLLFLFAAIFGLVVVIFHFSNLRMLWLVVESCLLLCFRLVLLSPQPRDFPFKHFDTWHTLWLYQSLSRHISWHWPCVDNPAQSLVSALTCCLSGLLTLTEDPAGTGSREREGGPAQVEPDSEERRRGQTTHLADTGIRRVVGQTLDVIAV